MQLAADERRPKSLLRLLKAQVSSLSLRMVEERECGSQSGANARSRWDVPASRSSTRMAADPVYVFESRRSRSGESRRRRFLRNEPNPSAANEAALDPPWSPRAGTAVARG